MPDFGRNTVSVGRVTFRTRCRFVLGTAIMLSFSAVFCAPGGEPGHTGSTCRDVTGCSGAGGVCPNAVVATSAVATMTHSSDRCFVI